MNNKTKKIMMIIGVITCIVMTIIMMDDISAAFIEGWNNPK